MRTANGQLRHFSVWRRLGWLMIVAIIFITLVPPPPGFEQTHYNDKVGHLAAYGLLTLWFAQLYVTRRARIWHAALFIAMGIALEFCQGALGYRSFDYGDIVANVFGVVTGALLAVTNRFNFLFALDRRLAAQR